MSKYFIESLGCAKNLVDSEVFAAILERAGYEAADYPEEADLVLVNTCSFLEDSLRELHLVLSDLAILKQEGQFEQLLVTGCLMNRGLEDFAGLFPEVDAWIGLKDFAALERRLRLEPASEYPRTAIQGGFHRYLRVSDGCSNNCSYCAIPSIRGGMSSVPIEALVKEAEALAGEPEDGWRELVVIAQDTANYGLDIYGRKALPELLERLAALPQYRWIRVMYMHPDHFETAWLELWKRQPKLLPYFEIPIQHSEDRVLKAMNRKKGRRELEALFTTILKELPQAVLRTTVMSGFPGETKAEALALKSFVAAIPFLHLGVFNYSREAGTPAFALEEQVPPRTAARRMNALLAWQAKRREQLLESYVGRSVEVLVEEAEDEDEENAWIGRAWFQAPEVDGVTYIEGSGLQPGQIIRADVTNAVDADLFAAVYPQENEQ
ncbi:MAG TPA: 30S ribosomal protein S12 methylthiotransferase RimO [Candidatus Syntrophosphaera sp.]|nr:30S ribosomal protein S12 methylthiotransferase RimO [Candidatus Syntrophosphaera sp.]HPH60196.1 30S ribosomal protein S12 methylthiotransferase RimO [Candidatus Syntrophosphaera sp.]